MLSRNVFQNAKTLSIFNINFRLLGILRIKIISLLDGRLLFNISHPMKNKFYSSAVLPVNA